MTTLFRGSDEEKPLFRQWSKKNPGESDLVEKIKLSRSGEWVIVEGQQSTALINGESKAGQNFWKQVQKFNGAAVGLLISPAKGKLGFDIVLSEVEGVWEQTPNDEVYFTTGEVEKVTSGLMSNELWDAMVARFAEQYENKGENNRVPNNPSGTGNTRKRNQPKPVPEPDGK